MPKDKVFEEVKDKFAGEKRLDGKIDRSWSNVERRGSVIKCYQEEKEEERDKKKERDSNVYTKKV